MTKEKYKVVGLGEILWDLLPSGKHLGGAPANFAYITTLLGDEGTVASRVGSDALGREATKQLEGLGLAATFVQKDVEHPTGTVKVEVHGAGLPTFEIAQSVAWDFLEWTPQWQKLASETDAVCFGSLAQRTLQSHQTIRQFLMHTRPDTVHVFDVNLRQCFYSAQVLGESAKLAQIVKLNHDELPQIMRLLELSQENETASARRLLSMFGLKMVCVTRGDRGSLLVTADETCEHPGFRIQVVDTVGAGDAFTAGLVHHYLRGCGLEAMNDSANRLGAWVARNAGATPVPGSAGLAGALANIPVYDERP
jgi:fructokinase